MCHFAIFNKHSIPNFIQPVNKKKTFRYSDVIQPTCTVTQEVRKAMPIAAGKKVKSVSKPTSSQLCLRTENEDTCNSDDFSSFYQANSGDCK